jgi:hypothetical protein
MMGLVLVGWRKTPICFSGKFFIVNHLNMHIMPHVSSQIFSFYHITIFFFNLIVKAASKGEHFFLREIKNKHSIKPHSLNKEVQRFWRTLSD